MKSVKKRETIKEGYECYREESGVEYKKRVAGERAERVFEKKMHGRFFREVSDVADQSMFEWVKSGSEGFIFAAQEQALPTNFLKAKITGVRMHHVECVRKGLRQ